MYEENMVPLHLDDFHHYHFAGNTPSVTGTTSYAVTFSITFVTAIILPVALLGLTFWIASKFNKATLVENFARFGYAIIALDMAGHIAHNLSTCWRKASPFCTPAWHC